MGIPRSSFYYFINNNPEAVAEIQAIIEANTREQLGLILQSKTEILRKVIAAGIAEDTSPKDRLAIYMKLNELQEKISPKSNDVSENEKNAAEFLKQGPRLHVMQSRFAAGELTDKP